MTSRRVAMLRRTAHIALDHPRLAAWTFLAAACAFVIGGAALLAGEGALRPSVYNHPHGGAMVVYLGDGVGETAGEQLAAQLAAMPGVLHAKLVPALESSNRLAQALSADPALLDGIDLTTIPASIEVGLSRDARDVIAISPAMQALRDTPGVVDIVVEANDGESREDAAQRLKSHSERAAIVIAALALVMAIGVMRIWLERDREAYRVFHLLGASPGFAWGPTVLAGALLGGAAATCAAALLAMCLAWYGNPITAVLAPVRAIRVAFPSGIAVIGCIVVGAAAGAMSGWLAGDSRATR